VQAFHVESFSVAHAGEHTGEQGLPPQQFSVRKPSSAFMVAKFAV
jgi:hypothetical protein